MSTTSTPSEEGPAVSFEAMQVSVKRLPDRKPRPTKTVSGGYEITAVCAKTQKVRTFEATALNINGMAIAGSFEIGEYGETVTLEKDRPNSSYLNLRLSA